MAWKYYFCASNIVTEGLIILQALFLIGRIQAPWKKKVIFGSIFLTRILYVARETLCLSGWTLINGMVRVIIASAVELAFTSDVAHSADPTFEGHEVVIVMQAVQCSSIVTACWGQVKPFLNQLRSNGLRIEGAEYRNTTAKASYMASYGRDGTVVSGENGHELVPGASGHGNTTTVSALRTWDSNSQSSQAGMIRETRTWGIIDADEHDSSLEH